MLDTPLLAYTGIRPSHTRLIYCTVHIGYTCRSSKQIACCTFLCYICLQKQKSIRNKFFLTPGTAKVGLPASLILYPDSTASGQSPWTALSPRIALIPRIALNPQTALSLWTAMIPWTAMSPQIALSPRIAVIPRIALNTQIALSPRIALIPWTALNTRTALSPWTAMSSWTALRHYQRF